MKLKHRLLAGWVLIVFALHQDFWNWTKAGPLLLGMLPPGLTYHLGYSALASFTMALLVKYAWPAGLDDEAPAGALPSSKTKP